MIYIDGQLLNESEYYPLASSIEDSNKFRAANKHTDSDYYDSKFIYVDPKRMGDDPNIERIIKIEDPKKYEKIKKQHKKLIINKMSDIEETSSNATSSNYNAFGSQKLQIENKMFQDEYNAKQLKELPPMYSTKLKPVGLMKGITQPEVSPAKGLSNFIFQNSRNSSHQTDEISNKINKRYNDRGKIYLQQLKMIETEKSREAQYNELKDVNKESTFNKNLPQESLLYVAFVVNLSLYRTQTRN